MCSQVMVCVLATTGSREVLCRSVFALSLLSKGAGGTRLKLFVY
jgi:hypothetical protein